MLHRFAGPAPVAQFGDGALPNGGLVLDNTGVVYGTTYQGGNNVIGKCEGGTEGTGCGTVFALQPPMTKSGQWSERLLHVFMNGNDGTRPTSGVVLGVDGSLYGAANGGPKVSGLVFRLQMLTTGNWDETVLYAVGGESYYYSPAVSGFDSRGNLYGTTNVGPGLLDGSVFRLNPPTASGAWHAGLLYHFTGGSDRGYPTTKLIFRTVGSLFGTTQEGGDGPACQFGCGTVFELAP